MYFQNSYLSKYAWSSWTARLERVSALAFQEFKKLFENKFLETFVDPMNACFSLIYKQYPVHFSERILGSLLHWIFTQFYSLYNLNKAHTNTNLLKFINQAVLKLEEINFAFIFKLSLIILKISAYLTSFLKAPYHWQIIILSLKLALK